MRDMQLVTTEIRHTFLFNDEGEQKDIAELSFFNDGSIYIKIFHRDIRGDHVTYSNHHKSLAEFREKFICGVNEDILKILKETKRVHVLTDEGMVMFKDCCRGNHAG